MGKEVICVVGPTASGKTALALLLARELNGEIVSADSRQVYRDLDAGTAKPVRDAQGRVEGIACHLIDCADPSETFDAGRFARMARPLCERIRGDGRTPIIAGGTGLYLRAFLEGLSEMPGRDEGLRARLEEEAREHGRPRLHERLAQVDRAAAEKIPANNIQRVIRALEVHELTGRPISSFWSKEKKASGKGELILSIEWSAEALKNRISERAARMWPNMLREVRELTRSRYTGTEPGFQSLGYREALLCVKGELSENKGLEALIRATLAYAKRQRTWFRHQLAAETIAGGEPPDMLRQALKILARKHETVPA